MTRILGLLIALTIAGFIALGFAAWSALRPGDRSISLDAIKRVVADDEILTMAARLAATDGSVRWEHRYREHAPVLARTIDELRGMASTDEAKAALARLDAANDALVRAENDALRHAREGRLAEARAILDGGDYVRSKSDYANALRDLLAGLEAEAVARERGAAAVLTGSFIGALALLGIATAAWIGLTMSLAREQRQLASLLQAQKMEAVGRLAGGVAHDFNNMLTAINGYAGLAAKGLPEGSTGRADIDKLRRVVQNAADLTRRLLDFARRRDRAPVPLEIDAVIREFEPMLRRVLSDGHEIAFDLAGGRITADPVEIQQVLLNLVVNARDAMPQGGRVTVTTRRAADRVVLSVADTGVGMTAEVKARLFEPWFTTKESGGTGLGLAIVGEIVRRSGGTIEVDSEPEKGTVFRLTL